MNILNRLLWLLTLSYFYCGAAIEESTQPEIKPVITEAQAVALPYPDFICTMWHYNNLNDIITKHDDFTLVTNTSKEQVLTYGNTVFYFDPLDPCNYSFETKIKK